MLLDICSYLRTPENQMEAGSGVVGVEHTHNTKLSIHF